MRIQNKLFVIFLFYSITLIGLIVITMQLSINRGMLDYVNTKETELLQPVVTELAAVYAETGSWQALQNDRRRWWTILRNHKVSKYFKHHAPPHQLNRPKKDHTLYRKLSKLRHIAILDQQKNLVLGFYNPEQSPELPTHQIAIAHNGETVGWLVLPKRKKITEGYEFHFLEQQKEAFIIISLLLITLAIAVAFPLARHFVRPINRLAQSTQTLTQGDYQLTLNVDRGDELGQLANDFNELAKTLSQNESSRKRWLADISHELRTPLAILRGEVEAIIDGIRPASPENIRSLHQEIVHLNKLVDDLYMLSNTDIGGLRYKKHDVELGALLQQQQNHHQQAMQNAGLEITYRQPSTPIIVWADETRLNQLLDNLLSNSLKYTDTGGSVVLTLATSGDNALITVDDSAPSVPDTSLNQLFDHLYRVDDSRNRNTGGSGLGLAICRQIIEAHNGEVCAKHSALGGLSIIISLPLKGKHPPTSTDSSNQQDHGLNQQD